jgi:hypothetical protein
MKRLISLLSILFLLLSPALADELTDTARASLTEVMSYTAEEAARFVFEPQPDGSLHYWLPEHPDWVYTMELLSNGAVRCASPFDTRCVYQTGEGILRELLRLLEQKDWLENWNENARRELLALCHAMGVTRQSTALRFAETAAQAVDGLLERGGIDSMLFSISLTIIAMMFGGIMEGTGMMGVVVDQIKKLVKTPLDDLEMEKFFENLERVSNGHKCSFVLSISSPEEEVPEYIRKYTV